jgi:hypothetical protein
MSIDLRARIAHFLPEPLQLLSLGATDPRHPDSSAIAEYVDKAVLVLSRYLVLLRLGPVGLGCKGNYRSLDPRSVRDIGYTTGPVMLALAIAASFDEGRSASGDQSLFSSMRLRDLGHLPRRRRMSVLLEGRRMQMLAARGLWADAPDLEPDSTATAMKGAPRYTEEPHKVDSHLPLPDEYVTEMGRRSLWLMRALGPNLLTIAKAMAEIWQRRDIEGLSPVTVRCYRQKEISRLLITHKWLDEKGHAIDGPPFHLALPEQKGFAKALGRCEAEGEQRWPPKAYLDVMALLGNVQMAHYFILALSIGARKSEALGLTRDCLVRSVDGRAYANGKTYKLVQRHDGEWRDWQLPEAAVEAVEQQVRLVEAAERIADLTPGAVRRGRARSVVSNHLWARVSPAQTSDAAKALEHLNGALFAYARTLDMDAAPGGQALRPHRLRKTLARLVGLALTQAPILLMDVFGHKTIEDTLYYILTDKDLRAEIETVTRELRVMRATEVIEKMVAEDAEAQQPSGIDLGGYGGLGAVSVYAAISVQKERVHRRGEAWGADSVKELAELLTLQGKAWDQVRRGVVCTKLPGEAGPCNKSKGRPEPSKCQSTCGHRLEESFLREDVDGSIRDSLAAYEETIAAGETLVASHWAAQVRAHVSRFPDLHEKWMRNPTVQALMCKVTDAQTA